MGEKCPILTMMILCLKATGAYEEIRRRSVGYIQGDSTKPEFRDDNVVVKISYSGPYARHSRSPAPTT